MLGTEKKRYTRKIRDTGKWVDSEIVRVTFRKIIRVTVSITLRISIGFTFY